MIEMYVNNAKVLSGPFEFKSSNGEKQLLYTIDEVLYPYEGQERPPSAADLLENADAAARYANLKTTDGIAPFASKISGNKELIGYFKGAESNTYFIPVNLPNDKGIDDATIKGHIIPGKVLFTAAMTDRVYNSAAYNDTIKVELKVDSQNSSDSLQIINYFVESNTLITSGNHHQGICKVKVHKANVPVSNGVIHFIEKPLMVISNTIKEILSVYSFLSEAKSRFEKDPQINELLSAGGPNTLLAFTNEAFNKESQKWKEISESEKDSILKLHVVPKESISSEMVRIDVNKQKLESLAQKPVHFNAFKFDHRRYMSVEGGGVNATVTQLDIGATNGMVHIIDRVLGIAYQTIKEKLEQDPNLRTTYDIGVFNSENWNDKLGDTNRKFTYFAPSKAAWEHMKATMPSEYKQLTERLYRANTFWILDRHLVSDKDLRIEDLLEKQSIPTGRGEIRVRRKQGNEIVVEWEDIEAPISRPDVVAMNGVIHEIDLVLMKKRDMAVSDALSPSDNAAAKLVASIVPIIIHLVMKLL
ncbi:fasciclin-1-like protein [Dinothrombium tinctorium]|uniref:Fasciclin-1-like protein n=1 Tax=Dinothrombium tinctorium TaxID=1965070 RepID=A0A3S3QID6_9ACAR|nr:fasciclin-1-like protein [Dinothrombium tinctorium]